MTQIAVKAIRFRFGLDGDVNDRSVLSLANKRDSNSIIGVPSRARDLEEARTQQCGSVPAYRIWVCATTWNDVIMNAQQYTIISWRSTTIIYIKDTDSSLYAV